MTEILFWPKRIFYLLCHFIFKSVLAFVYWRKKKTVPSIRNDLLLKSAKTLAKAIREEKLKSEDVVQAYIDRILEVEPYINAVVEDNFKGALEEARKVDILVKSKQFREEELLEKMPLLGVPFTAKCLVSVKGFQLTAGSLLFKDKIADEDAPTIKLIKKAGGIFLALTNSPEFGSAAQTSNLLYGTTCNPYDTTKTSGGSSGGESALLSAAGSVIGIGNDLAGSLRVPAHFCGLFSHKSTPGKISNEGMFPRYHPSVEYAISNGPMCRYSEDLVTMVNILSTNKININTNKKINFKKLKIYFQTSVKHAFVLDTDEEIVQAVRKAAAYFEKTYGSEAQEINIPLMNKANGIFTHVLQTSVPNIIEHLTDGKVKHVNAIMEYLKYLLGKNSLSLSTVLSIILGKSLIIYNAKDVSLYKKHKADLEKVFDELLDDNSVFLYPTFPTTAPYHYEILLSQLSSCYTNVFNSIGLPVTQCPMGKSKNKMPIGIQIVGCTGNDNLTLACAAELEKTFGGWLPPDQ